MDISLQQKQRVKKIIKYDISRKYFGDWAPRSLYNCYSTLYRNPEMDSIELRIGDLSVDDICNALWTEMSYNPVRFGTISPFKFDGRNSLQDFCNMEIDKDLKSAKTLSKVQYHLKEFYRIVCDLDENFAQTNQLNINYEDDAQVSVNGQIVKIKLDYTQTLRKPRPNSEYKMLAGLVRTMRAITSQNLADLNRKTYFEPMFDVILTRHQNLIRGIKSVYSEPYQAVENTKTDIPEHLKPQLKKYLRLQSKLEKAIAKKSDDIYITQARIDNLNNLENPGDTRIEQARLNRDNEIVEKLEKKLIDIKHKIANIKAIQYVM